MKNPTLQATLLALAIPFVLAGCGDSGEKSRAEAKVEVKVPAPPVKPDAKVKEPAPAAKPDAKPAIDPEEEKTIKESLAQLTPEDRKLAEAQKFCAVENENRLGTMGKPMKVMIKGKPVFLCCGSCRKQAVAEGDATLAKAEELRSKGAGTPPAPAK